MTLPSGLTAFQKGGSKGLIAQSNISARSGITTTNETDWWKVLTNSISIISPLAGGFRLLQTGLVKGFGSPEQMASNVAGYNPTLTTWKWNTQTGFKSKTITQEELVTKWITYEKKNSEKKKYWETSPVLGDQFKLPDMGELGKYALLGLLGIGGLYLLGKYVGRK